MHEPTRQLRLWQQATLIGAPLALAAVLSLHPTSYGQSPDEWLQTLAALQPRWLFLHLIQMPLFAALGVIVWWMLPRQRGTTSTVSRIGLSVFIVVYPAFDALVGVGSGLLLAQREALSPSARAPLDAAILSLFFDPSGVPVQMAIVASVAWFVGSVSAAFVLWRSDGWRVAVPLLLSGVALGSGHVFPQGPLAAVFVAAAGWQFLRRESHRVVNSAVPSIA